ncbi:hypothetical protein EDB80DRAFT_66368 [Ilyonectria destructans]|nr:hypothetical protein EDB80DRAFT_66368 [Ilyonectria destructans]
MHMATFEMTARVTREVAWPISDDPRIVRTDLESRPRLEFTPTSRLSWLNATPCANDAQHGQFRIFFLTLLLSPTLLLVGRTAVLCKSVLRCFEACTLTWNETNQPLHTRSDTLSPPHDNNSTQSSVSHHDTKTAAWTTLQILSSLDPSR